MRVDRKVGLNEDHVHEIIERIYAILQDGGEWMYAVDVLDCVYGSVDFEMTQEEKDWCVAEVKSITGGK